LCGLWKVTRSTRPARTSVELSVDVRAMFAMMQIKLIPSLH